MTGDLKEQTKHNINSKYILPPESHNCETCKPIANNKKKHVKSISLYI